MPSFPPVVLSIILLPILCNASPINRQMGISDNVFMTTQNGTDGMEQRVCSIDAVTYRDGETIPTSSPCEHCVCRPPGFACTITSCEYRPGCKAFRRSDQCCPEYQCECEKDGKIYQNGEKIMDTNNPCEVCYCQGGEIICAVIDCYWRNDCAPRYIDNRCCPMYDHCPPPAAQGPIRHRLPTLSSPAPISWHNLTTSVAVAISTSPPPPPTSTLATTEVPTTSTTTPTTTTTTQASTSEAPLNDEVSPAEAAEPSTEPAPLAVEPQAQSDDSIIKVEVSDDVESPAVAPTTVQPELESSLADDQQAVVMNDDLHDENLVLASTSHLNDENQGVSSTPPLQESSSQPSSLETSAVVDPTSNIEVSSILPSSSSNIGSSIDAQPTQFVLASIAPINNELLYSDDVAEDNVVTTSEPANLILQDDIPSVTASITPLLEEVQHDDGVADATQLPEQQDDTTEQSKSEVEVSNDETEQVNGSPTESVQHDEVQQITENSILDDDAADVAATTVVVPVVLKDDIQDRSASTGGPNRTETLVRHDLFDVNTEQPSGTGVQNDEEEAVVQATTANTFDNEESVFADEVIGTGSTEGPVEIAHDEIDSQDNVATEVPETNSELPVQDAINDSPAVTTTSSIVNDQVAEESATQQSDSLLPSGISHDDEIALADEVATEQSIPLSDASVTGSISFHNDDSTQSSQILNHDDSSIPVTANAVQQHDGESDTVTERIIRDYQEDAPEQAVTEKFSNDEVEHVTENLSVSQVNNVAADPVQVTEQSNQQHQQFDDAVPTERNVHDDHVDAVAQVTEAAPVYLHNSDNDNADNDVILADEPVTQRISLDESSGVTERIAADEPNTERIVEKADHVESQPILQDDNAVPTLAPAIPQKNNDDHVFDIILDDEVIPSQPETLNQVREQIAEQQPVNNLLEVNQDLSESSVPAVTTAFPQELVVREEPHNDEPLRDDTNVAVTTQSSSSVELVNDEAAPESSTVLSDAAVNEPTDAPVNDEQATQRQFRDDIDEMLQLRHHINGLPHEDEDTVSTTAVPPQQAREEDISVTTERSDVVILEDEAVAATTVQPESYQQEYKNKVQKVAEALQQFNVIPGSEERGSANKFRLEPDVFGGGSLEVQVQDEVTTAQAHLLRDDMSAELQTTVRSVDIALNDEESQQPTEQSVNDDSNDQIGEVSTERVVADDASSTVTQAYLDVLQDAQEQDEVATTPAVHLELANDEVAVEGSGSHHDETELDAVEGSGLGRLDLETTVSPVNDDNVEVTSSPSSYSFRMDILSSLEDAADGGSGNGEIQQDAAASDSTSPPPQNPVPESDAIPVTEQDIFVNDEVAASTTIPEVNGVQNDEASIVTTEATLSRFRTGLEEEIDAPVAGESQQNDFVEVSTSAPSGFAIIFRDNEDAAAPTQASAGDEGIVANHDQPANIHQAPDIIPEDDESATQANIPVLNLVASDPIPIIQQVAQDEAVTQAAIHDNLLSQVFQDEQEEKIANDEASTQSAPQHSEIAHDEVATEPSAVVNDEVAVTQNSNAEIFNDEAVTQGVLQDEPVSITQVVNDDIGVAPTDAPQHDLALDDQGHNAKVHDDPIETVTHSALVNDEGVTGASQSESAQDVANDEHVIFSDEPAPTTVQPVNRLRADSIEEQTEQTVANDDATAVVNDDISVTTLNPIVETAPNNTSTDRLLKVVKKAPVVLPETGLPKIQPISPDLGRNNPHELRFDFPMPPEEDHSWLSRAVNQFRRLAGFGGNEELPARVKPVPVRRARVPSRRFLLF